MKIRKRCRFLAFLYYELLILGVVTSLVHWFDAGDVYSYGRFVFFVFVPILFYRHFYKKEKREERKVASCHVGALVLAGLFMMPGTILEAADDSFWLCSIFYLAAIVVGFAGEYWRGQYLVVGCNPSVSEETKRRINVNRKKDWIPFYAAGILTVLLLFVAAGYKPEWNFERDSKEKAAVEETKEKEEPAAGPESQSRESVVRQQQEEQKGNFWLTLLRYTVLIVLIVAVVILAAYGIFKLICYLVFHRKKPSYEFVEQVTITKEDEEHIRLVPVAKREKKFPAGNDGFVRKAFYKQIQAGAQKNSVPCSQTPQELKETYLSGEKADEYLTQLYEKARYAKESVETEEIRKLHELEEQKWKKNGKK